MDALTGAALALAVGWASILLARRVPFERALGPQGIRRAGAAFLVLAALIVLGVPVPWWGPWALLTVVAACALAKGARALGGGGFRVTRGSARR